MIRWEKWLYIIFLITAIVFSIVSIINIEWIKDLIARINIVFTEIPEYAASKDSEVFHYSDCSYVKKINPENLIRFKTREEAIASGGRPCKTCEP